MKFDEDTILWAIGKLAALSYLKGFPETSEGARVYAQAVLRIAHPRVVAARYEANIAGTEFVEYVGALTGADELDSASLEHPDFGKINPLDWLIAECADRFLYVPKPIEMRRIFERHFPVADGREVESPVSDRERN